MAKTGTPLVDLEVADSEVGAAAPAEAPAPAAAVAGAGRGLATPAVRRIAREHRIEVSGVEGSGKAGRVTKEDILRVVGGGANAPAAPTAALRGWGAARGGGGAAAPAPALAAAAPAVPAPRAPAAPLGADQTVPLRGLSRAMSKSMAAAWAVPHFGFSDEVVVDALLAARGALAPLAAARSGGTARLTFLPFMIKAASIALAGAPGLNARVEPGGEALTLRAAHNIGVAMDTPRGLVVPNIKAVQGRSILEIGEELARLQALAAEGRLGEADLADTTFTCVCAAPRAPPTPRVHPPHLTALHAPPRSPPPHTPPSLSNIGSIGGTYMSPVIPPGTVAIGAIGRAAVVPRYAATLPAALGSRADPVSSPIVPATVLHVSWTADHRVVDGAMLARFSAAWKALLQRPETMLADLR
jgi:2-oxoisovalerate dehydrogenase E2 component (dihydrolipoyl transacylase)